MVVRARRFRQAAVRDLPDQHVLEPVRGLARDRRAGLLEEELAEQQILDRVHDLRGRYGRKVSLVGWSLGGIFARQIAKLIPGDIRTVITLGSPFSGNPKATHAWRLYEFISGHRVDDQSVAFARSLADPPPVPTTAIYSRGDGICAWQCCVEKRTAKSESIEVHGSHCGLGHNPAAVYAIADRLAQPEGQWQPFSRAGWRGFIYPEPV